MSDNRQTYLLNIDYVTFCIYLALVGIGGLFIFSVDLQQSGPPSSFKDFLFYTLAGKQVLWIVICLLVFSFIVFFIDHKFWQIFAYLMYGLGILGLVLVLIFGTKIKGATSWFIFGGASFQPSEIAKFGTCLGVAALLGHWSTDLRSIRHILRVIALFMVPVALILMQPDAGSALVFMSFFIVMFREGLNPLLYIIGFAGAATFILSILLPPELLIIVLAWIGMLAYITYEKQQTLRWYSALLGLGIALAYLYSAGYGTWALGGAVVGLLGLSYWQYLRFRPKVIPVVLLSFALTSGLSIASNYVFNDVLQSHQQQRIDVWLRPSEAKKRNKDSVMNLENSMLAIGAGQITGRGLFSGRMTQGRWVPEQDTDFIFCTIGEEQGLVGSIAVVVLYLLLILRITMIAERQKVAFNRIYAYGVAGILFVHFFVNIGMTMGLVPIIGIPLPFLSKGGSSLLGFTIMLAVLLKLDKHRGRIKKNTIVNF
ncbi:MAG: rod shape-determining protein RodA [Bacteroidota bacterium]